MDKGGLIKVFDDHFLSRLRRKELRFLAVGGRYSTRCLVTTVLKVSLHRTRCFKVNWFASRVFFGLRRVIRFLAKGYRAFFFVMFFRILSIGGQLKFSISYRGLLIRSLVRALRREVMLNIFIFCERVFLGTWSAYGARILDSFCDVYAPKDGRFPAQSSRTAFRILFILCDNFAVGPTWFLGVLEDRFLTSFYYCCAFDKYSRG